MQKAIAIRPPRKTLYFSVVSSLVLLLFMAFNLNILDALTIFLGGPLLGLAWIVALISLVLAAIHANSHRHPHAFLPMIVSGGALIAAVFVPFTQIWLYANFHLQLSAREQVIANIQAGKLIPNVAHNNSLIALPEGSCLSMGGDEIVVEGPISHPYVFFYTFRGILDNYTGFLWVPEGGKPEHFSDASDPETQIEPFGENWYFIRH